MEPIYKEFVDESFNENGILTDIKFHYPDNFNFAFDVLDVLAERYPDQNAMIWLSKNKEKTVYSYSDIANESKRAANFLISLGIGKGDRVLVVVKRHHQFWPIMMALCRIGAIAVPATFLLTKKDFVYRFNTAGISAVICTCDGGVADSVDESVSESPSLQHRISVMGSRDGWVSYDDNVSRFPAVFDRPTGDAATKSDDIMLMYFTSGTTGYPRVVAHSFTYPLGHIITGVHWHHVIRGGLHFTIADTGWGKAVWGKLYGQWFGESCVLTYDFDKFDAKDILSVMADNRVTTFCAPPTMYRFMIHEDFSQYDLSSLQYATTAGEALNPEVYNRFYKATGLKMMEGFGQTETTLTVCNLFGNTNIPGSMGKPSPGYKIKLVDNDDKEVEPGIVGEIAIDTTDGAPVGMFKCYYGNDEATEKAWHNNLYHTGDTAWYDEQGYLWFVGRVDDLIKSSGYRISPFEIESVLMEHSAVLECAVTGVPDELRGQLVKATIKLVPGFEPSEELADELKKFVKRLTAPYKYPRVIEFVDELPKTISGKIRRVEIRSTENKDAQHRY